MRRAPRLPHVPASWSAVPSVLSPLDLKELQSDPALWGDLYRRYQDVCSVAQFLRAVGCADGARYLDAVAKEMRPFVDCSLPLVPQGAAAFVASDGSAVAIDADGVVQHAASDSVLAELGLKPVTRATKPSKRVVPALPQSRAATARSRASAALAEKGGDQPE